MIRGTPRLLLERDVRHRGLPRHQTRSTYGAHRRQTLNGVVVGREHDKLRSNVRHLDKAGLARVRK